MRVSWLPVMLVVEVVAPRLMRVPEAVRLPFKVVVPPTVTGPEKEPLVRVAAPRELIPSDELPPTAKPPDEMM